MKCYVPDVGELGLAHYMLWSPTKAERSLNRLADTVKYYDRYLDQYPSVMVEHLEPVYGLARSLGAFDEEFLRVQLTELGGWRGKISGGLYALLRPSPELLDHLCSVTPTNYPENTWARDCAIAVIQKQTWPPECRCLEPSITIIRDAVNRLSCPETPIRRALEPDELVKFKEFQEHIRRMYHEAGMEQATSAMRTRLEYQWVVSHSTWIEEFAYMDDCASRYRRKQRGRT